MLATRLTTLIAACAAALLLAGRARADVIFYSFTGNIDTSDFLIISGSTLQWHHVDTGGAAVGRHSGNNFPTVITSSLNGVPQMPTTDWTPTWPDPVPNEIRFDAYSSVFNALTPAFPSNDSFTTQTAVVAGRGSVLVTQLATAANAYTMIVQFKDGFSGSANLDTVIRVTTTPEPASLAALSVGGFVLLIRRRSRTI